MVALQANRPEVNATGQTMIELEGLELIYAPLWGIWCVLVIIMAILIVKK